MKKPLTPADPTAWLNELMRSPGMVWPGAEPALQAWQQSLSQAAAQMTAFWTGARKPDAAAWFGAAQQVEGSWWPAWTDWLRGHAGPLVAAPRQAGNADFPVIEAAPGRYVKTPAA